TSRVANNSASVSPGRSRRTRT
ncbi:hypothetical protein, partial [Natrinema altunense]